MVDKKPTSQIPRVFVVYGFDSFLRTRAVRGILTSQLGVGPDDPACVRFDDRAEVLDVLDELRTMPMFSERRVVILSSADAFVSRHREALEQYCASPSECSFLLLVCERFDARTRLYKAVKKSGGLHKCEPLSSRQIGPWIQDQAKRVYKKQISAADAMHLRRLVGDDLATLDNELSKLSTYAGSRPVVVSEDIEELVGLHREEKVFAIADALADRDARRALALWDQVWTTDRAAPGRAVGGLAWALRRYVELKYNEAQGRLPSAAEARRFYSDPAGLARRLRLRSVEQFEDLIGELLRIDLHSKTGRGRVRTGVEKFIVRHCHVA